MEYDAWVNSSAETKMVGMWMVGDILERRGFYNRNKVRLYAGTSSGAITSLLLCLGYSYSELTSWLRNNCHRLKEIQHSASTIRLLSYDINGIFDIKIIEKFITELILKKYDKIMTMGELYELTGKELIIVTRNFTDQKDVYLSRFTYPSLSVISAVIMSSSIPGIFPKCIVMNKEYIDGCFSDSFPMLYVKELGYTPFGICASYKESDYNFFSKMTTMTHQLNTNQYHRMVMACFPTLIIEIKVRSNLQMTNFSNFINECNEDVNMQIENEFNRIINESKRRS